MNIVSRPVFVLGTACSGSSILSWGLAQHPRLSHALETTWLVKLASDLESLHALSTADPSRSRLAAMGTDRARFYEAFGTAVNDLLLSKGSPSRSRRRWVDCTPGHASHVAGLVRLFPRAKFIHIVRDVRAVVKALVSRPSSNGSCYDEASAYEHWLRTSKAILEAELAFGSGRILRVRHSDLLEQPERTLRRCLNFLDEPFCAECLRPFRSLECAASGSDPASCDIRLESPIRDEAELFSGLLLQDHSPNPERIARLDRAFGTRDARHGLDESRMREIRLSGRNVQHDARSLIQRVQQAASTLPADAAVIVVSKGDDELLKLGGRKASHFPQETDGTYAGFHPASSADAIAHLEHLRGQGHGFFLIPGPYFWWLEHYQDLAKHLHSKYRVVYYQEGACLIFGLDPTARGWSTELKGGTERDQRSVAVAGQAETTKASGRQQREARGATRSSAARPILDGTKRSAQDTTTRPAENVQPLRMQRAALRPAPRNARRLAQKLWGGFSTNAKTDLEAICWSPSSPKPERVEAAWELARWHTVQQDFHGALRYSRLITEVDESERLSKRHLLLEVRLHLTLGNAAAARSLIPLGVDRYGYDTDLCLIASNVLLPQSPPGETTNAIDEERLALINRVYSTHGLLPIRKIDERASLTLDNITSAAPGGARSMDWPMISVVVPAYNAAETIGFALAGLREQSWRNLEILVVDDASTDNTRDIVSAVAAVDERVKLICLEENAGAYVARNRGLEQATGEYITVHDADDWSHSQKIEAQITYLLENEAVGSASCWVRASRNLQFNGAWRPPEHLLDENVSSLMLPTHVVRECGGWDPVRTGADRELRQRLEMKFGKSRLSTILPEVPCSFSLDDGRSLTRQRTTHVSTLHFGVRREYHQAYDRWHRAAAANGDFRLDPDPKAVRKFPAPAPILSANNQIRAYDLVFVSDFGIGGGSFMSSYYYILAAIQSGLRVGVFHWRRYDFDVNGKIDERLARLIDEFRVDVIVADQELRTKHLVFYYPPILQYRIDRIPVVSFDHLFVIVNQMADRLYSGGDPQYDPLTVRDNLESLFGTAGEWFANSPTVRELMLADPRYPPPGDVTWMSLLDTEVWCARELRWRGAVRPAPVIGRHGRDHYTKWPQNRTAIEQAYCVHKGWETRFLGGADHAIKTLGAQPANWQVWRFDAVDAQEFLHDLDFLVHFPHEDYIEEFGRCAMEAMAVGVPVILSSRLAGIYGDAAIYCDPSDVANRIDELWSDRYRYLDRARIGREFVLRNCSLDQLPRRLSACGKGTGLSSGSGLRGEPRLDAQVFG